MSKLNRRSFVAGAAAAGIATGYLGGKAPAVFAQDKTELNIYHIWGTPPGGTPASSPAPMTQVVDAFNAQSSSVVLNQTTPGGYFETLQQTQADIAAGQGPDIVSTPWANLTFAIEGLGVNPLTEIFGDQFSELQGLVSEFAWPLVTREETVYGLPWGLSTPIHYYNADLFEQAGVDPVAAFATWESFGEAALAIQEVLNGNPVFSLTYNKDWPAQTVIQSNGGTVLNADNSFGIASPESIEAMATVAALDAQGLYDRGTSQELRPNFIAGSTAIWQASVASLGGANRDKTFNLGTSTWPKFGDKPVKSSTGGSFLGVYTYDESKYEALMEFFKFAFSEEGYGLWNQTGYVNISKVDLPRLEGQEPAYEQFEAGLELETNWPSSRGLEAQTVWGTYCERIWASDIPAEEGCNQAVEELSGIIG